KKAQIVLKPTLFWALTDEIRSKFGSLKEIRLKTVHFTNSAVSAPIMEIMCSNNDIWFTIVSQPTVSLSNRNCKQRCTVATGQPYLSEQISSVVTVQSQQFSRNSSVVTVQS
ncbi:hypothetical protein, partial [Paenibacillus hemerocallicola]|uniref:hypothetical protein n=1 Tax=Paenibacillus hemerocallicola TaxID=1172614 RepID=UPI001C402180